MIFLMSDSTVAYLTITAYRCMEMALKDGNVALEDVGYINAHGTSTQLNDKIETKAIKDVFGDHAYKLKVEINIILVRDHYLYSISYNTFFSHNCTW